MKIKNQGITIIIAMGTSLIVLALAFATLNSVAQSIEQANNIQRSTQLFFAAESGLEAAFFHHNARGQGTTLNTTLTQTLAHDETRASVEWNLVGRSTGVDTSSDAFYADILKENQTVQIPLEWDTSSDPTSAANTSGALAGTEDVTISFFKGIVNTGGPTAETPSDDNVRAALSAEFDDFEIDPTAFNFGNVTTEVLIDWSISRKNSSTGVETFIPVANDDCSNSTNTVDGFICESQFGALTTDSLDIDTTNTLLLGKILPGLADTNLSDFWSCNDAGGGTCSDFRITFRPLLGFADSIDSSKIIGIPFAVTASEGTSFPLPDYTVMTDVTQEDFSQAINLEIPERTSIGAFDYVIFD